ncbi:tRNA (adenosine(37)-N6)-threonylcarbamoyltransferase complex ATPase subunit type 1 TsaE [Fodinisporobacter ferrooxydans]|uniref:tRNA threonylcarbamoyladenosine biosynthesis protein TsaE n=1 Tax=Fodinisporobacter ferrooxydans TaxID=2901836 RepID=A0ABY4CSH3_9BACL|nr:tRNA (adenosine(37)-N6)-threonylcarbamoyltransferase complex ATPase subunit type 1 TsaE [Alicyclobacillaceae bacterium MYW30-H2]
MVVVISAESPRETQAIGKEFVARLSAGDVICLDGDLGAGKTTFTQGIAMGLGIHEIVNSPTFTLIQEYVGTLPLYHMDLYRLGDQAIEEELGLEDYMYGKGITVIEWSNWIERLLPEERWVVAIEITGVQSRSICITGVGERPQRLIKEWEQNGLSRP